MISMSIGLMLVKGSIADRALLEACRRHLVVHLVCYASFSSVYGMNREVPYAVEDQVDNSVSLYALPKER